MPTRLLAGLSEGSPRRPRDVNEDAFGNTGEGLETRRPRGRFLNPPQTTDGRDQSLPCTLRPPPPLPSPPPPENTTQRELNQTPSPSHRSVSGRQTLNSNRTRCLLRVRPNGPSSEARLRVTALFSSAFDDKTKSSLFFFILWEKKQKCCRPNIPVEACFFFFFFYLSEGRRLIEFQTLVLASCFPPKITTPI